MALGTYSKPLRMWTTLVSLVVLGVIVNCDLPNIPAPTSSLLISEHDVQRGNSDVADTQDFLRCGIFGENETGLAAWLAFSSDGRYRVAKESDFEVSENAKMTLQRMFRDIWNLPLRYPAISGNIKRTGGSKDIAVIVVDNSLVGKGRFGFIIFNISEKNLTPVTLHWVLRGRDLSSAILSWHSNWPVLVFIDENGKTDPYYINWNAKRKKYFLGKEQRGPDARPGSRLRS